MAKIVSNVSEFTVENCDNGFILRYSGQDADDNWSDIKLVVNSVDELIELIKQVVKIPRNAK